MIFSRDCILDTGCQSTIPESHNGIFWLNFSNDHQWSPMIINDQWWEILMVWHLRWVLRIPDVNRRFLTVQTTNLPPYFIFDKSDCLNSDPQLLIFKANGVFFVFLFVPDIYIMKNAFHSNWCVITKCNDDTDFGHDHNWVTGKNFRTKIILGQLYGEK